MNTYTHVTGGEGRRGGAAGDHGQCRKVAASRAARGKREREREGECGNVGVRELLRIKEGIEIVLLKKCKRLCVIAAFLFSFLKLRFILSFLCALASLLAGLRNTSMLLRNSSSLSSPCQVLPAFTADAEAASAFGLSAADLPALLVASVDRKTGSGSFVKYSE